MNADGLQLDGQPGPSLARRGGRGLMIYFHLLASTCILLHSRKKVFAEIGMNPRGQPFRRF
jgi:hypothetical protein